MPNIITVIAYKENAVDTCRGCVMSRHDSDLDMFSSDKPESIVDFVATLRGRDLDEYSSFSFTYFVDGRCIEYEDRYVGEDYSDDVEEYSFAHEELIADIRRRVDERMTEIVHARKIAKEKEANAKIAADNRAKEARERAQYEALRTKFEGLAG